MLAVAGQCRRVRYEAPGSGSRLVLSVTSSSPCSRPRPRTCPMWGELLASSRGPREVVSPSAVAVLQQSVVAGWSE